MAVRFDANGRRWVELEFPVTGTPDEVWHAMATGPGNAAWFTTAEIDGKIGGRITFHFMPGVTGSGTVTHWEPPHRFSYVEADWAEGAPPVLTEIIIVARSDGECLVRMTHSIASQSAQWDGQMEGFESGWPGFIEVLRLYLTHHAGEDAASFQLAAKAEGEALVLWRRLLDGLGHETADVGENWTVDAGEKLFGEVAVARQDERYRYLLLRIDGDIPGVGFFGLCDVGDMTHISLCRFFYGPKAKETAAATQATWQAWLDALTAS